MKLTKYLKLVIILFAIFITSCNKEKFTVRFDSNGGSPVSSQVIKEGQKLTKPQDPIRIGFLFDEWYREAELENQWNFNIDVVTGDITLYGNWGFDPQHIKKTKVENMTYYIAAVYGELKYNIWINEWNTWFPAGLGYLHNMEEFRNDGFEIKFPNTFSDKNLGPFWPTFTQSSDGITFSDINAKTGIMDVYASSRTDVKDYMGKFELVSDDWTVTYMYSNRNFTVDGKSTNTVEFDCSFKTGWNLYYTKRDFSKVTTKKPLKENFKWYFKRQ